MQGELTYVAASHPLRVSWRLIAISCYGIFLIRTLLENMRGEALQCKPTFKIPRDRWILTLDRDCCTLSNLVHCGVELTLAIFIACGPVILAFCRHSLPTVFGGSIAGGSYGSNRDKNSHPLGSIWACSGTMIGKKSMVQASVFNKGPYLMENASEETTVMPGSGIHQQAEVWVNYEDGNDGKSQRNGKSIGDVPQLQ